MPTTERPGAAKYTVATKAVQHGFAVIEHNLVGQAIKQKAAGWGDAYTATPTIQIGEQFAIRTKGVKRFVNTGSGVAAAAVGDPIYIIAASNLLTTSSGGNVAFGRVAETPTSIRPTPTGYVAIDLDDKDSI